MARLLKERARKPVIDKGLAFAALSFDAGVPSFTLEIGEPWNSGKEQRFTAHLTKREALRVIADWTKQLVEMEPKEPTS